MVWGPFRWVTTVRVRGRNDDASTLDTRLGLRHADATQLLGAGVHAKAVSERLGQVSVAFTMDIYAAVIPSLGRAAADAADRLFGEEGGR